ncbi:hypothetical protein HYW55_03150 [Candidatus Gottesmanbacteria bacterium]|nr:hypothetical protein [Candidatus Gottesmanbacteria bacterium]
MEKLDIVWFIEHFARELDVACATTALLESKYQKKVKILPFFHPRPTSFTQQFHPTIVLLPYCYSIHDSGLKHYLSSWNDATFVNLSWEQVFYRANIEYKAPRDSFAKKCVLHHAWSKQRAIFLQDRGVPESHIFVNGQPAYYLYFPPYRKVFASREILGKKFDIDQRKKWIFFPENYSWYFYSDHLIEEIIKNGQDRKAVYQMRDYCGKSLIEVLHWLRFLKKSDNVEIIIRPRPATSYTTFLETVQKFEPELGKRIHILKDYTVRDWILASDIVVSSFSTSLIEAAIAKKPILMLEPFPLPKDLIGEWYGYVPKAKTKEELLRMLKSNKNTYIQLRNWAVNHFLKKGDPIKGLAKFLATAKQNSQEKTGTKEIIEAYLRNQKYKGLKYKFKASVIKIITMLNLSLFVERDDKDTSMEIIEKRLAKYKSLLSY